MLLLLLLAFFAESEDAFGNLGTKSNRKRSKCDDSEIERQQWNQMSKRIFLGFEVILLLEIFLFLFLNKVEFNLL